jgi:hypothetical protein
MHHCSLSANLGFHPNHVKFIANGKTHKTKHETSCEIYCGDSVDHRISQRTRHTVLLAAMAKHRKINDLRSHGAKTL